MTTKRFRRLVPVLWVLGSVVTIASCGGSGVSGTYQDPSGQIVLELKSGGTGHVSIMGVEQHDLTYKVEGNKLTLHAVGTGEDEDVAITINQDGTLGMEMWKLSKKK